MRESRSTAGEIDTIALLHEEISRLEDELRMRDAGAAEQFGSDLESASADRTEQRDDIAQERITRLLDDLTTRDETISLLLEQIRLADEAEAAGQAEWEQLNQWVQALEHRVEKGTAGPDLRDELAAERRNSEALRLAAEKEQRTGEIQRQALVAEVERLRGKFSQIVGESDTSIAAVQALENENHQLRDAYETLARNAVPGHEVDAIVRELQDVRAKRDAIAQELQTQRDERQREHQEYEANLNALRSQMARDTLRRQEEQVKTLAASSSGRDPLLEADDRIRALREHLKEIQKDESEQRMRRGLSARLSRLWHHTGPNP
jgi:hypothetical protein